jgi:hypothetical protein
MSRLVIVESPFAGRPTGVIAKIPGLRAVAATVLRWRNVRYARAAVRDSVLRGEAPIASHLLLTQPGILRDDVLAERRLGIDAGLAWGRPEHFVPANMPASAFYVDLGASEGMVYGARVASSLGRPVDRRTLPSWRIPWWARWCS